MIITAEKITPHSLALRACTATLGGKESKISMGRLYRSMHSPIRTQLFWIDMDGIPSFVSVHLVRHKIGVEHFVETKRDDRGGTGTEDRNTPVLHSMLINAQALITMAHARLCHKSHPRTTEVMELVRTAIHHVDPDLSPLLVPRCKHIQHCIEPVPCGKAMLRRIS